MKHLHARTAATRLRWSISLLFPTLAIATTIVGVSPTQSDPSQGYVLSGTVQDLSWTSSVAYSDVSITADLGVVACCPGSWSFSVAAYLTNAIGPAATAANVIASTSFTLSVTSDVIQDFGPYPTNLFQNLTLDPGSYNVVLTASADPQMQSSVTLLVANSVDPPFTVIAGNDVSGIADFYSFSGAGTPNLSFAPASTFVEQSIANEQFLVISDPAPEPSMPVLVTMGAGLLIAVKRYRMRSSG